MMAQLSRQQTLEQQRATKAWELVTQVKENAKEYNSWVKKSPRAGLDQRLRTDAGLSQIKKRP
jgi:hypothetical protein